MVEDDKLITPLTKAPNYRESKSINFNNALCEIKCVLDSSIDSLVLKTEKRIFKIWGVKNNNCLSSGR